MKSVKQKALYEKPTITVFNVAAETPVLAASINAIIEIGDDDNIEEDFG